MAAIILRSAELADAPRLAELIVELGHPIDAGTVAANLEKLAAMDLLPIVAVDDGDVIALCSLSVMQTVHRPKPVGRVSTMIVHAPYRGQGLGKRLVAEAEARLKAKGCGIVEITSNETRKDAHRFYESLGYERSSARFFKTL